MTTTNNSNNNTDAESTSTSNPTSSDAGANTSSAKNYRRTYVINRPFQIRFCLTVSSLVFLSSLIYPLTIYELITALAQKIPDSAIELENIRWNLIGSLAIFEVGFIAIVFIICIILSHKIAGPIYKLSKFLKLVGEGHALDTVHFRQGDYFPELEENYNLAIKKIKETHYYDFAYLSEVSSYLKTLEDDLPEEKKKILEEIQNKLSEIQEGFKQRNF